jgi:geranylgeranyl reductase family protein
VIRCDALVVGGGPAGSTCARLLRKAGWEVVVADRARFPRDKVCAGWLTPDVFPLLELSPAAYQSEGFTLQAITAFRTGVLGGRLLETRYPRIVSYAIRRCEFDTFLLRRAAVRVLENTPVETLRRTGRTWMVNDEIETPIVIGAGGHFCPVARHMRGRPDTLRPVVAKEAEFRLDGPARDGLSEAPALFFCRDMEGYGWAVRKGDYLNVGLGRRDSRAFSSHLRSFLALVEGGLAVAIPPDARWRGHAYLAAGAGTRPLVGEGLMLIGDAAGLAFPESGEGIRPAIESGVLAAEALTSAGSRCDSEALRSYEDAVRRRHPPAARSPEAVRGIIAGLGRLLLGSRAFTRHVVLNRWFLRSGASA